MKIIFTIFRKELIDTLRDKRTLITMVAIPLLVFPLVINGVTKIQSSQSAKERAKTITVGVVNQTEGSTFLEKLKARDDIEVVEVNGAGEFKADSLMFREMMVNESVDAVLSFSSDYQSQLNGQGTGTAHLFYQGTEEEAEGRIYRIFKEYKEEMLSNRLAVSSLPETFVTPVQLEEIDTSSDQEKIGKFAGGVLPYIFVIFSFIGCMYPVIDLFTGEKERGTIETILTAPVQRWQILVGKMMVVVTTGLLTAALALTGIFGSILILDVGQGLEEVAKEILSDGFVFKVLAMILPLTVFFAGILIPVAIYAKTFKEAQSIITPMNIMVILPVVLGFLPGIELSASTALVPVLNITLCTKQMIAGTLDPTLFVMVIGSLLLYAAVAVFLSFRQFGKEGNVLRA